MNEISFSYERMGTKTRFEKEAKGNSEIAYCISWMTVKLKSVQKVFVGVLHANILRHVHTLKNTTLF